MSVEALLDKGLRVTPAPLFRHLARHRLTVLAYHALDDGDRFRAHLGILRELARPVSLADVIDSLNGVRSLPDYAILVTFDDNDRSIADTALPELAKMEIPAAVFVVAGCLEDGSQPWFEQLENLTKAGGWTTRFAGLSQTELKRALKGVSDSERLAILDEIRQSISAPEPEGNGLRPEDLLGLKAAGIEVGNHSLTHPCLPQCSTTKIQHEIAGAHRVLTSILGTPPRAIAYPNGDCDDRVLAVARELGYEAGFLFDHSSNALPVQDRLRISRVRINARATDDRFINIISGLHPALHNVRTRVGQKFSRRWSASFS